MQTDAQGEDVALQEHGSAVDSPISEAMGRGRAAREARGEFWDEISGERLDAAAVRAARMEEVSLWRIGSVGNV